jgi:hypothetical protein
MAFHIDFRKDSCDVAFFVDDEGHASCHESSNSEDALSLGHFFSVVA